MKQRLGIIADDLTGANDTGVQFSKHGLATTVLLDIVASPQRVISDADVIVINTDSRWSDPNVAYSRVKAAAEVLKDAGVATVYKKIDSALRGNVGAELDAVMDAFNAKVAFVAPAFPDAGRVTLGGKQLLKDKPLDKSEMARDPLSPITESYVPALVKRQSRRNVGHVPLEDVNSGHDGLLVSFSTRICSGDEIIVIDAAEREHLQVIARAIASLNLPLVMAGSAGLAAELPEVLSIASSGGGGSDERCANGVLVVCGSASPTASRQLDYATAALGIRSIAVDAADILSGLDFNEDRVRSIVSEASATLAQGQDVLIRLNSDSCLWGPAAADTQDRAKDSVTVAPAPFEARSGEPSLSREYSFRQDGNRRVRGDDVGKRVEDSRRITGYLALLVKRILARCKVAGLVLTGGDTALAICRILEASAVALLEEIVPGVPSGRLVDGPYSGLVIVTKAGSFGEMDVIVKVIRYLHDVVLQRR
ncbi:MAG: four-carbon acid sugar kinase family protein [Betaproteobacteria bacterium]